MALRPAQDERAKLAQAPSEGFGADARSTNQAAAPENLPGIGARQEYEPMPAVAEPAAADQAQQDDAKDQHGQKPSQAA